MHLETGFCFEALLILEKPSPGKGAEQGREDELYACISRLKHSRILSALGCLQPPKKHLGTGAQAG